MALIQAARPGGGSGPVTDLPWSQEVFAITEAWNPGGLVLNLAQTPVDSDGVFIVSQGTPLYPVDYTISGNTITIEVGGDPDLYESGIWSFLVQYQYAI